WKPHSHRKRKNPGPLIRLYPRSLSFRAAGCRRFSGFFGGIARLDHGVHPGVGAAARSRAGAAGHGEVLGAGIVGDIVAAHFVRGFALEPRMIEELHLVELAVVFDAIRLTLDVLAGAVALLAKDGRGAAGAAVLVALLVLTYRNLVGAYGERPLRHHHFTFEHAGFLHVVDAHAVGLEIDRFAPVGPFRLRRPGQSQAAGAENKNADWPFQNYRNGH